MKRGPYKKYLNPDNPDKTLPKSVKRRRGITEDDINLSREEEVQIWLSNNEAQQGNVEAAAQHDIAADYADVEANEEIGNLGHDSNHENENSSSSSSSVSDEEENRSGDDSINIEPDDVDRDPYVEHQNQFKTLNDFLSKNAKMLNLNITINPADIVIMILTLALAHDFTLTAVIDVLKIINVICGYNLFPSTRYLFKKHFNPLLGTNFHLVCQNCKHYLGIKGIPGIGTCQNCNLENNVDGYQYEYSFITCDVKAQIQDILMNTADCNFKQPAEPNIYKDIHCGSMYKNSVPAHTQDENIQYISFSFNVDGTPISKDGKTSITPIYLTINELDLINRRKHLILAGLWYGKVKPRNDVFLKPFTDTFNELSNEGFDIKINGTVKKFKLLPICCCVDTVARSPLQGLVGVNGYYCCSWCELKGTYERNTVKYNFEHPPPSDRTETSFRDCYIKFSNGESAEECKGVNSVTPLLNLNSFNIVWGFTPDYLHCVLLGVVKRFLGLWLAEKSNNEFYIGNPTNIFAIDTILAKIKYPNLLKRGPVPLKRRLVMKGRELENWLLYYSYPLLIGILPAKFLNHWKLLILAISILLQDFITDNDINLAEQYLVQFVYYVDELYGDYEMTYNVHQLLHLAESCRRWGPLWTHTTFPFESSLRKAKRILKASRGVPQQIIRSLEMSRALEFIIGKHGCSDEVANVCESIKKFKLQKTYLSITKETLVNSLGEFVIPPNEILYLPENDTFVEYERFIKNNVVYRKANITDRKTDDSYVKLRNGNFGQIKHVLKSNNTNDCYIVLQNFICEKVAGLEFTENVKDMGNIVAVKFIDIKSTAIRITVNNTHDYVTMIPRNHYVLNM